MKSIMKTTVAAIALIGVSASAQTPVQNCAPPAGPFGSCPTEVAEDTDADGVKDTTFVNVDGVSSFSGSAVTTGAPIPDIDPVTGLQKVDPVTGEPLFINQGFNDVSPITEAYGNNATALGNGARVGVYVPLKPAVPSSCTGADSTLNQVDCEAAGETFTPAQAEIPAHTIPADNGTAIGAKAVVEHDNSTAIGAGAQSTDNHQVTLGTKDDTIRAEGITSKKSKARQVGPIELVTSDSGGRLATDGGETFRQINANSDAIANYGIRLEDAEKSIAIATAMPDAWLSDSKSFGVFGSVGGTGNETAVGFAAIGRIDETWSLNAKLGTDTDFEQFGWQVGAGAQW